LGFGFDSAVFYNENDTMVILEINVVR